MDEQRTSDRRTSDHDLLIEINTKLGRAIIDIKDMRDDTQRRLDKIEQRTEILEAWKWYIIGIATALSLLANMILNKINL